MSKKSEIVEAILGLALGIPTIIVSSWFIANTCNLVFPTSPNSPGCASSESNFFGIIGIVAAGLGVIAVAASIAVLIGRKRRNEKT